jgi:hypothetical protein
MLSDSEESIRRYAAHIHRYPKIFFLHPAI